MAASRKKEAVRAVALRRAPTRKPAARWTVAKREVFLAELATGASVGAAARAAEMSESSAYRLRARDETFRAAWTAAAAERFARLEMALFDRALNGTVKPIWYGGKEVGTVVEFSERLALNLLERHDEIAAVQVAPAVIGEATPALVGRVADRLQLMGERLRAARVGGVLDDSLTGSGAGHGIVAGGTAREPAGEPRRDRGGARDLDEAAAGGDRA